MGRNSACERAHIAAPADGDPRTGADDTHPGADVFRPRAPAPRRSWDVLAVIALGGGAGSVARYLVEDALPAGDTAFPWATFAVNVTGCLALGALMVFVLDVWPPRRYVRPFLGVGFLGGYTTFSTCTGEIVQRVAHGAWPVAIEYAAGSLAACLAAVCVGLAAARAVTRLPLRRGREVTP
ncbi:fluoride efflux transporter CrcB [Microbispora sp. RL4-1S]|uniref:Fluoride-specific ion channel FluC n=1 Tax=Microbispora oryzae TaxID=2806554 RepID=A0A941ARY5_9ACTN|nr:fluoride efflux transporter CrcB [Microbispora oryzae]MBP2706889.1 fluoride efflux transporter CrcB [Microbispora oryzae]